MISNSAPVLEALAGEPIAKSPMRGAAVSGCGSSVQSGNPAPKTIDPLRAHHLRRARVVILAAAPAPANQETR